MVVVLPAFADVQLCCKLIPAVLFQRFKSTYTDANAACSGWKQAQPVISREWFREHAGLPLPLMVIPGKEQEMRIVGRATAFPAEAPGLVIQTTTATRLAD